VSEANAAQRPWGYNFYFTEITKNLIYKINHYYNKMVKNSTQLSPEVLKYYMAQIKGETISDDIIRIIFTKTVYYNGKVLIDGFTEQQILDIINK
jgi:hypothetical protein